MSQNENSKLFMLKEMQESMTRSIENVKNMLDEQRLLCAIVEQSEHAEKFAKFLEETHENVERSENNISVLEKRADSIKRVCDICDKNATVANVVDMLLDGLGVFSR